MQRKLDAAGAQLVKARLYERNVRYENELETLTNFDIVVRLRQDDRARLTYKGPAENQAISDGLNRRFEAEVEVSDFDTMALILEHLGYHPYMTYEKYRTTYTLDETEVVLDELPYGNFIEVEGAAPQIEIVLGKLALSDAYRYTVSYADLFERVRHRLQLDFQDLTFDNFSGITVPESAFRAS